MRTVPVITALLARFIFKERLAFFQWIAIGIAFCGIVVLTLMGGTLTVNNGILWLIIASFILSTYNLLQRIMTKKYSPLTVSSYSILIGTVMLFIFSPSAIRELQSADIMHMVYVLIMGVFSSAIAYIFWAKAFMIAENTSSVSNYMFITTFAASILGFIFAGEVPDFATVIGGMIIMFGVLLFFKNNLIKKK